MFCQCHFDRHPKMGLVKAEAARKLEIRFPFYVKTPSFRVDLTGTKFSKKFLKEKKHNLFTGNVICNNCWKDSYCIRTTVEFCVPGTS